MTADNSSVCKTHALHLFCLLTQALHHLNALAPQFSLRCDYSARRGSWCNQRSAHLKRSHDVRSATQISLPHRYCFFKKYISNVQTNVQSTHTLHTSHTLVFIYRTTETSTRTTVSTRSCVTHKQHIPKRPQHNAAQLRRILHKTITQVHIHTYMVT